MTTSPSATLPLAVFDSGLGGLTVVRALRALLPAETIAYFGDTARLPYGTKSAATVHRFTRQCLGFLMKLSPAPKLLVVACNTASALALEQLKGEFPVPVIGVLEPGARAAAELAGGGAVGAPEPRAFARSYGGLGGGATTDWVDCDGGDDCVGGVSGGAGAA